MPASFFLHGKIDYKLSKAVYNFRQSAADRFDKERL